MHHDAEQRHRSGYYASLVVAAVAVGGVLGVGLGAAWIVDGPVGLAALAAAAISAAGVLVTYYRSSYVAIDAEHGVVRLSRWGDEKEFPLDRVAFRIPAERGVIVRAVYLEEGELCHACPLLHQGQLVRSRRLARFVEELDSLGVAHHPAR